MPWSSGCSGREQESTVHTPPAAHKNWGGFSHDRNKERREPHWLGTERGQRCSLSLRFFKHTVLELKETLCYPSPWNAKLQMVTPSYVCEHLKREFITRQIAQNTPNVCYVWTERKRIVSLSTAWNILDEIRIMAVKTCQQPLEFSVFHCIYFPASLQIQIISSMTGDQIRIYKSQNLLCAMIISKKFINYALQITALLYNY